MSETMKTSTVLLSIVTAITAVKFVLYYVSHSSAVLSEAWHSFSDLATTALVVFAIYHQGKKNKARQTDSQASANGYAPKSNSISSLYIRVRNINSELKISAAMGMALMAAASSILWQATGKNTVHISNPLVTGAIFIGLSGISYFVYRFEASLAQLQKSAALEADSLHNRADMIISLLTGISLIAYYLGHDFDRVLSIGIALYIFAFALEITVNSLLSIFKKESKITTRYRFMTIIWRFFSPRFYAGLFGKIDARAQFSPRAKQIIKNVSILLKKLACWALGIAATGAVLMYCSTLCFTVKADQQAILLRFGKMVNTHATYAPGLHFKLPWPIDQACFFTTQKIREISVGNQSFPDKPLIWNQEHGDDRMFISGDNNLFLPYVKILYKLKNPFDYYISFKQGGAEKFLEYTAYRTLIRFFAENSFYDIALSRRKSWSDQVKAKIQTDLDGYATGLFIVDVCIDDLHPPLEVAESYEDVVAAFQVKEKFKNSAQGYAVYKHTQERSNGLKTVVQADADVFQKIQTAQGEAVNYLLQLQGYNANPSVIRQLLTLETTAEALAKRPKILIDPQSGISQDLIYMENYLIRKHPLKQDTISRQKQ